MIGSNLDITLEDVINVLNVASASLMLLRLLVLSKWIGSPLLPSQKHARRGAHRCCYDRGGGTVGGGAPFFLPSGQPRRRVALIGRTPRSRSEFACTVLGLDNSLAQLLDELLLGVTIGPLSNPDRGAEVDRCAMRSPASLAGPHRVGTP